MSTFTWTRGAGPGRRRRPRAARDRLGAATTVGVSRAVDDLGRPPRRDGSERRRIGAVDPRVAQLDPLVDEGHGQAARPRASSAARGDVGRAVPVAVGLHDRAQRGTGATSAREQRGVVAHGRDVDLGPGRAGAPLSHRVPSQAPNPLRPRPSPESQPATRSGRSPATSPSAGPSAGRAAVDVGAEGGRLGGRAPRGP